MAPAPKRQRPKRRPHDSRVGAVRPSLATVRRLAEPVDLASVEQPHVVQRGECAQDRSNHAEQGPHQALTVRTCGPVEPVFGAQTRDIMQAEVTRATSSRAGNQLADQWR